MGTTAEITINFLRTGYTCLYKIRSTCGAPAFKPDDSILDDLEFEFVEFNTITSTEGAEWNNTENRPSWSTYKQNSPPIWGAPARNHNFTQLTGGNKI